MSSSSSNSTVSVPLLNTLSPEEVEHMIRVATAEKFRIYVPVICFMITLIVVGSVGNALVFWTYYRRINLSSTNMFIFSLSILDFIGCSFGLSSEVYELFHPYTNDDTYLCSIHTFVSFGGDLAAGYIIVCISCDRFMRIARPHQGLSIRVSRISVSAICASSIIISSFCLFIYGARPVLTNTTPQVWGIGCGTSSKAKKTKIPLIFSAIILFAFVIGFILLLTVYIRLGVKVHRWYKTRVVKKLSADKSDGKPIKPCRRTKSTFSDESSSKIDSKDPSTHHKEVQMYEFSGSEKEQVSSPTAEFNGLAGRPNYVRQLSKSLDKNNFFKLDPLMPQETNNRTLPLRKSPSYVTDSASRPLRKEPSSVNSFSVLKRRMKLSKTTIMFITAAVAFFASHLPYTCVKVVTLMYPKYTKSLSVPAASAWKFAEYSYSISYVANPVIYSFMNPNFRKQCRSLIDGIKKAFKCRRGSCGSHRYDF